MKKVKLSSSNSPNKTIAKTKLSLFYQKYAKIMLIFLLSLLLSSSVVLIAMLSTRSANVSLVEQRQSDVINQRKEVYQQIKSTTKNLFADVQLDKLTRVEQDVLQKYDALYLDNLYNLLDNNVDTTQLVDFLFSSFGDYEYSLLDEIFEHISTEVVDQVQSRGYARVQIYFYMTLSMFIGLVGGAVALVIPAIATFIAAITSTFGGIIGTIVGWITGLAIGGIIGAAIESIVLGIFNKFGIEDYVAQTVRFDLISKSGWWVPNFDLEINIYDIISLFI